MDIEKIISEMTLEEKVALCQGADFWHTMGVERLGVPRMMMSDGPHGLRKQEEKADHLGVNESIRAVCFPTAAGTAASFDRELLTELGGAIAQSAQAENLGVVLGPAANIKRSPLCGRNFEYFSEDPYLSGEIAAAFIRGVQAGGVGTSLKHFAANNQETRRMSISAEVSQRALREIYLASFEGAVKKGQPWTVMCSYNKINGTYSSENPWLLTDVLRHEWGFDGVVMTDWGAVNDHAKGVAAGLELEMPRSGDEEDRLLAEAVRDGRVSEATLDEAVRRMLTLLDRYLSHHRQGEVFDREAQHAQARAIAREAMVLLKNDGGLLPLKKEAKVAMIGAFAKKPRFQGGGSSHIHCSEELSALEAAKGMNVVFAPGFSLDSDAPDEVLMAEAVSVAAEADTAVLFLGLPDRIESEGYDRLNMKLPEAQNELVRRVAAVQPRLVVVLHNGAPVEMPWIDLAPAVLEAYLAGQAGGGAVIDLLYGMASPCGKLAETFPLRLEDTPSYTSFPGGREKVYYGEGIYVGYRWYDKRDMKVLFPFGHGLTYTTFTYRNLRLSTDRYQGGEMAVSVDVTNSGSFAAKEIVQIYVRPDHEGVDRPVRELKGFAKIALAPGESGTVTIQLDRRSFAYWDEEMGDWRVEPGRYVIEAAASSRDIRLSAPVDAVGEPLRMRVTADTTWQDASSVPGATALLNTLPNPFHQMGEHSSETASEAITDEMNQAMFRDIPLHALCSYGPGCPTRAQIDEVVRRINEG